MRAKRRLILIHGFTERPSMWDALISALHDPELIISTPSIPGHGNHPEIPDEHTARAYCQSIIAQIPHDDLPCIIIGHSMGGYLASTLVTMIPERVVALGFFHSKAGSDNVQKIEDRKRAIIAAALNKDLYLATMLRNTLADGNAVRFEEELKLLIEAAKADISEECITAAQEVMIERPDNVEFLTKAKFPIHYFLGKEDKSIPFDQLKSELERLPSAFVRVSPNTGHMGQIEALEESKEWLLQICNN